MKKAGPLARTGLHGKFSAPYVALAALHDGRIDLASFSDAAVLREPLQSRLASVTVTERTSDGPPGVDLGRLPVTVTIVRRDGRRLQHTVEASPGSPDDPLTLPQLRRKWLDCLAHGLPAVSAATAGQWFDEGIRFERLDDTGAWLRTLLEGRS